MSRRLICERSGSVRSPPERNTRFPFGTMSTANICEVRSMSAAAPSKNGSQSHCVIGSAASSGRHMMRSSSSTRRHSPEGTSHVVQVESQIVWPEAAIETTIFGGAAEAVARLPATAAVASASEKHHLGRVEGRGMGRSPVGGSTGRGVSAGSSPESDVGRETATPIARASTKNATQRHRAELHDTSAGCEKGRPMKRRRQIEMSADEQRRYLADAHTIILTSLDRHGYPHSVAMWFVVDADGTVAMTTFGKSQKALNLRRDPRCALLVETGRSYEELMGLL